MGEENWAQYQRERIKRKSDAQTARDRNSRKSMRWRRDSKRKLIEYKGGKCQVCGYNKDCPRAYHFHHRDPATKLFGISQKGCTIAWEKLKAEADKCDLLCSNCHAETHDLEEREDRIQQLSEWDERNQEHCP